MTGSIEVSQSGGVARVVLDNPKRRNAVSLAMWEDLARAFEGFSLPDSDARVVLLRGSPEGNAFSPGADLTEFPELRGTTDKALAYKARTHHALETIHACPVPVLVLIDGPCIGGGLEIALAADMRLATPRSTFGLPVIRLSNSADLADVRRLVSLAGATLASEMLLTASTVSAERAYAAGLLSWLGDAEALEQAAQDMAERILAAAPRAVRLAKQALRAGPADEQAYEAGVRNVLSGADFAEATQAVLEKRAPRFTGA
jgi:enoyl-CoA hydratase/carnithine racemase